MHVFLGLPSFLSQVLLLFVASPQRRIVPVFLCLCALWQSGYTAQECCRPFLSACPVSTLSPADTVRPTVFLVLGCSGVKRSHKALLG